MDLPAGTVEGGVTRSELRLAARNHGMPLEALRYPVTPVGLHYLLIHYDIPAIAEDAWRLEVGGAVARPASLSLADAGGFLLRPAFTLACVTLTQTVLMTGYLRLRAPGRLGAVMRAWRVAAPVGAAGMLASLGWFAAFTLASAAQVKAVGQVELFFSWLTAWFAFGERPSRRETLGMALVAGGIVLVVLG